MRFDPTINLGTLIAAAVLFVGFATAHIQNVRRMERMETKVDLIFRWFSQHVIGTNRGDQ